MEIVKAALEGFAHRYSSLGIRLKEDEARSLVVSVIRRENPRQMPTEEEVDALSRRLVDRIADLTKQRA